MTTETIKVVGSIALRPGMALVVHGSNVTYEGPAGAALRNAAELPGSVVLVTMEAKKLMDKSYAKARNGKPLA